jgi:hypothetical protein
MSPSRLRLALCVIMLCPALASAQLPTTRLNSIFPSGARQGTTVECTIGPANDKATGLYFSNPGITAEPAGPNKFKVTVAKDVPVGKYDVRLVGPLGVSNFRAFAVSDWPEVIEKEPNNEPAQAQQVTLPVVINGRIDQAADVDHYVFPAKKGQRIFIDCWAWRIDSKLDGTLMVFDAAGKELAYNGDYYGKDPFIDFTAPEDGNYTVKIWDFVYDGSSDHFYRLHIASLPHIDAVVPAAVKPGAKTTVTFYGRNLPDGKPAPEEVRTDGQPLEMLTREIEVPADALVATGLHGGEAVRPQKSSLDGMDYRITTADGSSNPIFLAFSNDPILVEQEPNNDLASAQKVPVPCDVTGTFSPKNDVDFYKFPVKKGEKYVVEVYGERQSGQVDPVISGYDQTGKRIANNIDDIGANIGQIRFSTRMKDPRWEFTAGADGDYAVSVRDLYFQQRGDPRFTYRVSIRKRQPDFRLVVVPMHEVQPDAPMVGRGGRFWVDVLAFRQDGFDEPISVTASDLPAGVTCEPVVIGPGKTSAPLIFQAAKEAPVGHAAITVTGKATVEGNELVRVARSGGLTWPTVNTPGIARMSDTTVLSVREKAAFVVTAAPGKTTLAAGEKITIPVKIERAADWADSVQLSGFDLPTGATVALVTVAKNATEGQIEVVLPANSKPGTFTFCIHGAGQVPREYLGEPDPSKRGGNVRVLYPSNPITLTIEAAAPVKK